MDRNTPGPEEASRVAGLVNDHSPPVQSLEEALTEAFGWPSAIRNQSEIVGGHCEAPKTGQSPSVDYLHSPFHSSHVRHTVSSSRPLTPLQAPSPASYFNGAMPSTPKSLSLGSLRLSDSDSHVTAEGSLCDLHSRTQMASGHCERSELELVMPSLTLPNRRPFTERGKRMGQLTVCVAGRKGILNRPL
jgi:hypothetical protein